MRPSNTPRRLPQRVPIRNADWIMNNLRCGWRSLNKDGCRIPKGSQRPICRNSSGVERVLGKDEVAGSNPAYGSLWRVNCQGGNAVWKAVGTATYGDRDLHSPQLVDNARLAEWLWCLTSNQDLTSSSLVPRSKISPNIVLYQR